MRKESLNIAKWDDRLKGEATAFIRALEWVLEPPITGESDVEAEREACAQIADEELKARRECLNAADKRGDQHSYSGHWFAITAAETIGKEIRARSAEKGEGEK